MIITLCGSARFEPWFHMWNEALSLAGHCVFGLASYPSQHGGEKSWYTHEEKETLDGVHFAKIRASDAVLFLNVFAYLGESSLNELQEAKRHNKQVVFLESWGKRCGIGRNHFQEIQDACARFMGTTKYYGSPIDATTGDLWGHYTMMGPAGDRRSRLVELIHRRETDALGFDRKALNLPGQK